MKASPAINAHVAKQVDTILVRNDGVVPFDDSFVMFLDGFEWTQRSAVVPFEVKNVGMAKSDGRRRPRFYLTLPTTSFLKVSNA